MPSAPAERVYLVTYDIADDGRRSRMARRLEARGLRVQWSVFELVATSGEIAALIAELSDDESCFDPGSDSLRCYPLCARCRADVITCGTGLAPARPGAPLVL